MDADMWGGIVLLVVFGGAGLFCFVGAIVGPKRTKVGRGGVLFLVVLGAGMGLAGALAFVNLTLTPRGTQTLTVTGKYSVVGSVRNPGHDYVETTTGIYEASLPELYDSVHVGSRYNCRVADHGYTGKPDPFKDQSALESCHLS